MEETFETLKDGHLIAPPPIVIKTENEEYLVTIGNMQFSADKTFVLNLFHSARRALGFDLK